jgi:predicted nucleic acid-binding protein
MANKVKKITSYVFKASDELLLDANVWLFLYGPQRPGDHRVAIYSQAFAKILAAQSRVYIDVLVVSEFINTYARLKYNILATLSTDFKQFRQSSAFKPVARDIAADVKRILHHCTRLASGFETLAIEPLLTKYAAGDSDFNDQVLMDLCLRRGLKLVTDDGDFKQRGIPVITANKRLLA